MASRIPAESSFSHIINAPVEQIDLAGWLLHLTSAEFQRCCPRAHIAAGLTRTDAGLPVWIAVERIGGRLLVHQYHGEIIDALRCRLISRSDAFTPSGQTPLRVAWELRIEALDEESSEYINELTVAAPGELLDPAVDETARPDPAVREFEQACDEHNEQETPLIAASIERRSLA